jgi:hypothetical protein
VGFVNKGQTPEAKDEIGKAEIPAVDYIEPITPNGEEAGQGESHPSRQGSRWKSDHTAERKVGVGIEPVELEAGEVGPPITTPHEELNFSPRPSQGMARFDGLNAIGPFHGKADVGEAGNSHFNRDNMLT